MLSINIQNPDNDYLKMFVFVMDGSLEILFLCGLKHEYATFSILLSIYVFSYEVKMA